MLEGQDLYQPPSRASKSGRRSQLQQKLTATIDRAARAERRLAELEEQLGEMEGLLEFAEQRAQAAESYAEEEADAQSRILVLRLQCDELELELQKAHSELQEAENRRNESEAQAEDAEERAYEAEVVADTAESRAACAQELADDARQRAANTEAQLRMAEQRAQEAEQRLAQLESRFEPAGESRFEFELPDAKMMQNFVHVGIRQARRYDRKVALILISLLTVKRLDSLQKLAGSRLLRVIRDSDILGRVDEDTFAVLLAEHTPEEDILSMVEGVARRTDEVFERPLLARGERIYVKLALAAAIFPNHGRSGEQLYERAGFELEMMRDEGRAGLSLVAED